MSIMIKGAEMPKGCAECPCILEEWMCGAKGLYVHNELINPFKERPNWCPLAEVVRCKDCKYGTWKISKLDNKTKVDVIPSADVEPVRHGHWECKEVSCIYGKKFILTCSECGESVSVTEEALPEEHYCRSCGARMDGEEQEHE